MQDSKENLDRRELLIGSAALIGGACWSANSAESLSNPASPPVKVAGKALRHLLVLEISGGNDGLNTIIPYADDLYHKARTRTGIRAADVLRLDDYRGFHPNLAGLRGLYDEGLLAIIEGAGYPHPNRSHFTSQDIWHTAHESGRSSGDGWLGRLIARMYPDDSHTPHAVHVGTTKPYALQSSTHPVVYLETPPVYRFAVDSVAIVSASGDPAQMTSRSALDRVRSVVHNAQQSSEVVRRAALGYEPRVEYPDLQLGRELKTAAALLKGNTGARVLSVAHTGYDTHDDQRLRQDGLLADLDGCLSAFFADMRGTEVGDELVVLMFSEFGRRVEDNASNGTDHGTAGPVFVLGKAVKGGLYGKHPSLADLDDGDLKHTTDFRSVYSSVIQGWLDLDAKAVLGAEYPRLPLFA